MRRGLVILFLGLCVGLNAKSVSVRISNGAVAQENCPVVLGLDSLPFSIPQRQHLAVFDKGQELASQIDDLDGDGKADELSFEISLQAYEQRVLTVRPTRKPTAFEWGTWAQMYRKGEIGGEFVPCTAEGKTYGIKALQTQTFDPQAKSFRLMHHHGVALESDLMAYRLYFDNRQTVDVYAKKTPRLELAQSLWYPNEQQLAAHFGDDVLKVGNTIGVGSLRPWNGEKLLTFAPFETRTQRIVSTGKVRSIVEIDLQGWQTEGKSVHLKVRYTLYAHHRDMLCEVFLSEPLPHLVTGVQQVGEAGVWMSQNNLVGAWGTDWPVNDTIHYAKETVGLGVCVPRSYAVKAVGIDRNLLLPLPEQAYLCFYLTTVAQKEDNPPARTSDSFFQFLLQWQKELENRPTICLY